MIESRSPAPGLSDMARRPLITAPQRPPARPRRCRPPAGLFPTAGRSRGSGPVQLGAVGTRRCRRWAAAAAVAAALQASGGGDGPGCGRGRGDHGGCAECGRPRWDASARIDRAPRVGPARRSPGSARWMSADPPTAEEAATSTRPPGDPDRPAAPACGGRGRRVIPGVDARRCGGRSAWTPGLRAVPGEAGRPICPARPTPGRVSSAADPGGPARPVADPGPTRRCRRGPGRRAGAPAVAAARPGPRPDRGGRPRPRPPARPPPTAVDRTGPFERPDRPRVRPYPRRRLRAGVRMSSDPDAVAATKTAVPEHARRPGRRAADTGPSTRCAHPGGEGLPGDGPDGPDDQDRAPPAAAPPPAAAAPAPGSQGRGQPKAGPAPGHTRRVPRQGVRAVFRVLSAPTGPSDDPRLAPRAVRAATAEFRPLMRRWAPTRRRCRDDAEPWPRVLADVFVPGKAQPQGSVRPVVTKAGRLAVIHPAKLTEYRARISAALSLTHPDGPPRYAGRARWASSCGPGSARRPATAPGAVPALRGRARATDRPRRRGTRGQDRPVCARCRDRLLCLARRRPGRRRGLPRCGPRSVPRSRPAALVIRALA